MSLASLSEQAFVLGAISLFQLVALLLSLYVLVAKRVLFKNIGVSIYLPLIIIGESLFWFGGMASMLALGVVKVP